MSFSRVRGDAQAITTAHWLQIRVTMCAIVVASPARCYVAKPNYSFEKRQREIAKKNKKKEKTQRKLAAKEAAPDTATAYSPSQVPAPAGAGDTAVNT